MDALKRIAIASSVIYSTVSSYARRAGMTIVDFMAIPKLARTFDVRIEEKSGN
ncbi:XRE family transcriptional regulator [Calothrix sp. NIES-2100]|uniref:hypothetical protein n=1 Tax=Calothrix sp. NIES-2100 TaxID=1954172 RepID=UPI000B5E39C6|nr:XRE family transcriptional regulator [Calothrix sp. NIES-2100]